MGKKKKKKKQLKHETRADMLLSRYPEEVLDVWYGDNADKRRKFGEWLLDQEIHWEVDSLSEINKKDLEEYVETELNKLDKLRYSKDAHGISGIIRKYEKIVETQKKIKKRIKREKRHKINIDMGIATYMNSSRYRKMCLDKDSYRKYLKDAAKEEKREYKQLKKLGYIKSNDPDKELERILRANSAMGEALLSDSYVQKHPII